MFFGLSAALFWFLIALILGAIEILSLSFFLIWPAIAALVMALLTFIFPGMALGWQLVIFAVLSLVLLIPGRRWAKNSVLSAPSDEIVNDRAKNMIGKMGNIVSGQDGMYRVKIGDSEWGARGDRSLKTDDLIRVTGVDGIMLLVETA